MTLVVKGQTLSFTIEGAPRHESRGAVVIGDDGTILWRGRCRFCRRCFVSTRRKTMAT